MSYMLKMMDEFLGMMERLRERRGNAREIVKLWDDRLFVDERREGFSEDAIVDVRSTVGWADCVSLPVLNLQPAPESGVDLPLLDWETVEVFSLETLRQTLAKVYSEANRLPTTFLELPEAQCQCSEEQVASLLRLGVNGLQKREPNQLEKDLDSRRRLLKVDFGFPEYLLTRQLLADCTLPSLTGVLCKEARRHIRYREGLPYKHVPLLLEALSCDALVNLRRMVEGPVELRDIDSMLCFDGSVSEYLMKVGDEPSILRESQTQEQTVRGQRVAQLRGTIDAWNSKTPDARLLGIHEAERAYRLAWMLTWTPIVKKGVERTLQGVKGRIGKRKTEKATEHARRQRAHCWASHIVDYCREHGSRRFGDACKDAARYAIDNSGKHLPNPKEKSYSPKTIERDVGKFCGLYSSNVMSYRSPEELRAISADPELNQLTDLSRHASGDTPQSES